MHRLADDVVAPERERQVRDPAADVHARTAFLDQRQRLDEVQRVAVVLGHAGRDGQHVRVEDDVLGRETDAGQQVVGATADRHLALDRVRLPLLVEGHHHGARAVRHDPAGPVEELLLALLQADRVDHALALHAFQAGLEHRPLRAVDHDRDPGHLGLGRDQVQEGRHRLLGVQQVGVHVDVQQVRAAADLLQRHVDRGLVVVALDQPAELGRPGHVGPLTDHHEAGVGADLERLQAGEARGVIGRYDGPRRQTLDRGRDPIDVGRRGPATTADDVDQAGLRELVQHPRGLVRRFVVPAEGVGQARVRVRGDEGVGEASQVGDVRAHLGRAERAVHADDERLRVLDRAPERLDGLSGQRPAAQVDDRHRDPQRQLRRDFAGRRRSRPCSSGCRRWSRSAAGRRRPRPARRSARRTSP